MDDIPGGAEQAKRYLVWASFLLAVMLAILIIDLQLKRAVARQAAQASAMLSEVRHGRSGQRVEAPADHGDIGGGGDDDRVGGTPPGSADDDHAYDPGEAAAGAALRREARRADGHGERADEA